MKSHFHVKEWAPRLALRKRLKVIRKWPIYHKTLQINFYCDNALFVVSLTQRFRFASAKDLSAWKLVELCEFAK